MIVPQYWAESRLQHRHGGQQMIVRRFGWSDSTQVDAQAHAEQRAQEALHRLLAGDKLPRRERKTPYNGASGMPIREEIVDRRASVILTRNSYGARCLNTPDVLFADLDFHSASNLRWTLAWMACGVISVAGLGWLMHSASLGLVLAILGLLGGGFVAQPLHRLAQSVRGGAEGMARKRIAAFVAQRPQWHLRVYRTPAGLRVLAMHRTFDPADPAVTDCFKALGADPIYVRMCLNQHCFRARVSAKPWRIGVAEHIRPRPGVWPVQPARMAERQAWVARYEGVAQSYAACSLIATLGSGVVDPQAQLVQEWHDELCRAGTQLPLA